MRKVILALAIIPFFSSCNNGERLADEFCKCVEDKGVLGCKELMSQHLEELDESAASEYITKTSQCTQKSAYEKR